MESRGVYIQEQFDKAIQSLEAKIEELASRPEIEFAAIKEAYVNHPIPSGGFLLTSQQEERLKAGQAIEDDDHPYEPEPTDSKLPSGVAEVNGRTYDLNRYYGNQWVEFHIVNPLHYQPAIETPQSFAASPHRWQLRGAAQMHYLCKSIFRGGICGDEMGLGKTLLAILVMEQARKEHGSYSLVVCPASCRLQWQKEILNAYNPGLAPKVLVLDDISISVHQLLDERYDIVIVSYNFLGASHRANSNFVDMFSRYVRCECPRPSRPICALTSEVWKLVNLPFKRVILDECQKVKNEKGAWYNAVKSLHHNGIVMLSGTVLANRWHDIGAPLTLLHGHPFETKEKFLNAFASDDDQDTFQNELLDERLVQLQRFLMGVLIARPASILNLPLLTESSAVFKLNNAESQNVLEATNKFVRARFHSRSSSDKAGVDGESLNPLGHAVRAQLLAAHPLPPPEHNCEGVEGRFNLDIDDGINENVVRIIEAQSGISVESRNEWLARLDAQDTESLIKSTRVHAFLEVWDRVRNSWPGEKAIIFSSYLKFLDILAVVLKRQRGVTSLRFDGTLDDKKKESVKDDFMMANTPSPLLITTGCGGTGINLQAASVVIQMEPWWNRNHEKQAYARCFRTGQTKEVKVFKILAENSAIDGHVMDSQERKAKVNNRVMEALVWGLDQAVIVPDLIL